MKTGRRYQISRNEEEYRTASLSEITVSDGSGRLTPKKCPDGLLGKKLKKRLEDLERRAGSSSASPELKHEELPQQPELISQHSNSQRQRSSSNEIARGDTPDVLAQQYVLPSDDRGMFSQQFTRQLSTSPPPFSYASISGSDALSYATYPPAATFCLQSGGGVDMPMYPQYLPVMPQQYQSQGMISPPIKQEIFGDDEMSPFSMSYASMAGVDVSSGQSYQNFPAAYVSRPHPPPYPNVPGRNDHFSQSWHPSNSG